jgi:pyrroline-5-carboxylate reductase
MNVAILGLGNMGLALAQSLQKQGISVCGTTGRVRSTQRLHGISLKKSNTDACKHAQLVILAVKPWQVDGVMSEIRDVILPETIVMSVVAGLSVKTMDKVLQKRGRLIRAMPNRAFLVQSGCLGLVRGPRSTSRDLQKISKLFGPSGVVEILKNEAQLDAFTALAGCGPGYFFAILEALENGSVQLGLSRAQARRLALATLIGSGLLAKSLGHTPWKTQIASIATKGGVTEAGLKVLKKNQLSQTLIQALKAARQKSKLLSKPSKKPA